MVQANRDQDCLEQFRACHIVGLVGTNRTHDFCIQQTRLGPFTRLQWSKGEPSTGLELWVHRRYISPKHFRGHWSGEGELQGRVGAARFKTPQLDLLCIVAYMPPNGTKQSVSEKICRWMCEVVSAQGHRCVPLVFLDGNAHLGLDKVPGAQHLYTPSQSPSIGRANAAPENQNGTLLRKFADRHFLCFSNTFFPCSPTFYANHGGYTSRTDYIMLPQSLLSQVKTCEVWNRAGDALQIIDCPARRDHRPVVITVHVRLQYNSARAQRVQWDHDKLSRCLHGHGDSEFVLAVEGALAGAHWRQLAEAEGPDGVHHALHEAIHAQALQFFTKPTTQAQHRAADPALATATSARRDARLQLRAMQQQSPDDPLVHQAVQQCQTATAEVRRIKRARWRAHQAALVREITEAWRRRDFATAWKVSRLLGGARFGPKKRCMVAPAPVFAKQDWLELLCLPGPQGGVAATPPQPAPSRSAPLQREHFTAGTASAYRTRKALQYTKLRRTPPPWSFPAAVWRILLERRVPKRVQRLGLGATHQPTPAPNVHQAFTVLHASMQATGSTPQSWHRTGAFTTPKHNGKQGLPGQRLLHTLESLGKAYFAQLWKRMPRTYTRHYATGYLPHRRREQAILQQSVVRHRLQKAKISHATAFYDLANAFASASHTHTLAPYVLQSQLPPAEQRHLLQRLEHAQMVVQCSDGELQQQIGSGSLPGDSIAGPWFLAGYHHKLDRYLHNTSNLAITAARPPQFEDFPQHASPAALDVSFTSYADDVARTFCTTTALQLHNLAQHSSDQLSQALAPDFAQNTGKQEVLPYFGGNKANTHLRNVFTIPDIVPGKIRRHARYLGPYLAFDGKLHDERARRVQAAKTAYYTLRGFWSRCRELRWRQAIFRSMVVGAAHSGLVAMVVDSPDTAALDRILVKLGRKVLQGKACAKDNQHKAANNESVWRMLRGVPSSLALVIDRLCWWQAIVKRPQDHASLLYAFFGSIPGTPTPFVPGSPLPATTHAWMRQLASDLQTLADCVEDDALFCAAAQPSLLLQDSDVREVFLRCDPRVLKAKFLGTAIPPPGWMSPPAPALPDRADAVDEDQHTCRLLRRDGHMCGAVFPTYRALKVHQVHSNSHTVQVRSLATLLTVCNQCCACKAILASKKVARNHLFDSISRGFCSRASGSATVRHVTIQLPSVCAVCDEQFNTLREVQAHLVTHLPLSFQRARLDHYWRHGWTVGQPFGPSWRRASS